MAVRLFLITGHGRSGTNYMGRLFTYFGFDVGCQKIGKNGMAHNFPQDYWPPTKTEGHFQYLIQVVRDPWKVAESTYLAKYSLPLQNSKLLPAIQGQDWDEGTKLEKTVRSIVLWNRAIAEAEPDLVVKAEEADTVCKEWVEGLGLMINLQNGRNMPPPKNYNHRTRGGWDLDGTVPWDELDAEHLEMFKEHCRLYGYPDSP